MPELEELGQVVPADVLIIGGGIGGLAAAIKLRMHSARPNVLVVDKATIGWSGKAPKGGGSFAIVGPDDDPDRFVEYMVNRGYHLNDQDILYAYARESWPAVQQVANWGVRFVKGEDGNILVTKHPLGLWSQCSADLDMVFRMTAMARRLGAKMLSKVQVVDLLMQDGRVAGAAGFSMEDGKFHIFPAKAVILANGSCNYRISRMRASGTGDGIAAAYRAGAEMRNAEFGNLYDIQRLDTDGSLGNYSNIVNTAAENLYEKYVAQPQPDLPVELILGMEKETREGRGPLYLDVSKTPAARPAPQGLRPKSEGWNARLAEKAVKYGVQDPSPLKPVLAVLTGECSCVRVDGEMKTTIPGLWAIGDTSYGGSAQTGALPAPKRGIGTSGLMQSVLSAIYAAPSVANYLAGSKPVGTQTGYEEASRLRDETFAPMRRENGTDPWQAIFALQEAVSPVKYMLRRSADRLEEGLSEIADVQRMLPELGAKDAHCLGKVHEARAMALCAELTFRAALARKESRGWHVREDFPASDDANWLKWVIIRQQDGKMSVSTEAVPIEKYRFKP